MSDPVVDRLEVVEIEHDQGQPAAVSLSAGDLTRERLVEVAAVVQAGERVEVRELAGLAESLRVLDRRPRAQRQLLELAHLVVGPRVRA